MSIADGLMGRGEGTRVLAHIDPGDTATLFFELGGSKVCELCVCWEVLFFFSSTRFKTCFAIDTCIMCDLA